MLVEGRLKFDIWQDKNGINYYKHSIIVESMEMLYNKENTDNQARNDDKYYETDNDIIPF
ncbi:single-stranded DNA-binding protein [Campylobacter hyointestinalis subsp. lawsonii]|uniref:Single-stranded DNA-binding protein n=1 Tax=Campylobacter hyointestinalis subsp. lawsonii TaxID=91353 RepID=A0AAV6EE98_CAMHY|nr:single-stranded DNA-binding protein [Campylobacter hyointestinalis subsp. lawsonii]RAZ27416.1 hypothetical protein CHLT_07885 [Campylobacter hyointestinalis subsp. lawsonii]RAZ51230.1 hypothetical protein CHL10075_08180 [Campylobacter hyointestinalis subsp. lawsonii]